MTVQKCIDRPTSPPKLPLAATVQDGSTKERLVSRGRPSRKKEALDQSLLGVLPQRDVEQQEVKRARPDIKVAGMSEAIHVDINSNLLEPSTKVFVCLLSCSHY